MTTTRPQPSAALSAPPARLLFGLIGGFAAGVVFIAINAWFATTQGNPPLMPFMVIASLVQGPMAVMQGTASVVLGMAIHSVLSALLGLVFAALTVKIRDNAQLALYGLIYGGLVYVVDFVILAQVVPQFKAFTMTNQPLELAVHLVFGAVLVLFLLRLPRES